MVEPATKLEGRRLGRYVLRYLVARGGMGSVYLAQLASDHGFEKWVAVKVIHPHLVEDERIMSMFLDEARLAARIAHPNICHVTDFGTQQGVPYLVLEYLHGESLASVLKRASATDAKLPHGLAARIVADAARGLEAAHQLVDSKGELLRLVHRDISPQNLFVLYSGATKVIDFGIARARGRMTTTRSGELKGKLGYMAPEQLARDEVDARTDIWALGVVLWEALTCRRLFRAENEAATLVAVLKEEIVEPSKVDASIPRELGDIAMRLLVRPVHERLQSAGAVANLLERWLYSSGEPAGPAQVADWMHAHFGDRRATRDAMLLAPELPIDVVPEVELEADTSGIGQRDQPTKVLAPSRPRSLVWSPRALAGGLLATAVAAGLVTWAIAGEDDREPVARKVPAAPAQAAIASVEDATADGSGGIARTAEDAAAALARPLAPASQSTPADASPPDEGEADAGPARPRPPRPGRLTAIALHARGGEVYVDGRRVGRLPLPPTAIPAGRRRVEIRVPGRTSFRQTVRVSPGGRVSVGLDCRQDPCVRR